MNVLALNAGSNTLRFKLVSVGVEERTLKEGTIDKVKGEKTVEAAQAALGDCLPLGVDAVGVRVVHGGEKYIRPTRVTTEVLAELKNLEHLAPLHLPTDLAIAGAARESAPSLPVVAVFDTAFHADLPEVAARYALPDEVGTLARRFGFHGIAHQFATRDVARLAGLDGSTARVVSLHLGGGASACAVLGGRSIDTSMGLTPLEGLVMSTRSGDLDPGLVLTLLRQGRTIDQVEDLLYRRSGLRGLSGRSDDLRDLEPAANSGDERAELALGLAAYRVRKYIGAYAAALGGLDALALSGALAENSATFRARVLSNLEWLGICLDASQNTAARSDTPARLSGHNSPVAVWLVPADEERQIAREVFNLQSDLPK